MDKCDAYHTRYNPATGKIEGECWGTKECDPCSCHGNKSQCDYYSSVREESQSYLTQEETIEIVNEAARKRNKLVPVEFYRRMLNKC